MWQNSEFKIRLNQDSILDYEMIMLSSGMCSLFLQMHFISDGTDETAWYHCSGFAPISSYKVEKTEDALYILEKVLLILNKSVEYFISPAKVTITADTVFYNKDTDEVKMAYIPLDIKKRSLRRNLAVFTNQLKQDIRDGKGHYLTDASKYILQHNYDFQDMISKVGTFKRQLYLETHQ